MWRVGNFLSNFYEKQSDCYQELSKLVVGSGEQDINKSRKLTTASFGVKNLLRTEVRVDFNIHGTKYF